MPGIQKKNMHPILDGNHPRLGTALSAAGLRPAVSALFVVSSIVKGNPPLMKHSKGNFHMAAGSLCLFHMCLQRSGRGGTQNLFLGLLLRGGEGKHENKILVNLERRALKQVSVVKRKLYG